MPDYFEAARLQDADLISNSANRVPVCICVDASYSMQLSHRIEQVNAGIRGFIDNCKKDSYTSDAIDLCLITFGGNGAKVILPFQNVANIEFSDIVPSGGTPLGGAVNFAVQQIQERVQKYSESGITCYKPWLVIMSDGGADDVSVLDRAASELNRMYRNHEIKLKCIGIGKGDEMKDLAKLCPNGQVEQMGSMKIENFFSMLSQSAANLSTGIPGEDDTDYIDL